MKNTKKDLSYIFTCIILIVCVQVMFPQVNNAMLMNSVCNWNYNGYYDEYCGNEVASKIIHPYEGVSVLHNEINQEFVWDNDPDNYDISEVTIMLDDTYISPGDQRGEIYKETFGPDTTSVVIEDEVFQQSGNIYLRLEFKSEKVSGYKDYVYWTNTLPYTGLIVEPGNQEVEIEVRMYPTANTYRLYSTTTPEDETSYKLIKYFWSPGIYDVRRFTHLGLENGTEYFYKVKATNVIGDAYSLVKSAIPEAPGPCFIATAAYGSPMAKDVDTLRALRDQHLMKNKMGRLFVKLYYRYSPPIAAYISDKPALRSAVRAMLKPLVWFSEKVTK